MAMTGVVVARQGELREMRRANLGVEQQRGLSSYRPDWTAREEGGYCAGVACPRNGAAMELRINDIPLDTIELSTRV